MIIDINRGNQFQEQTELCYLNGFSHDVNPVKIVKDDLFINVVFIAGVFVHFQQHFTEIAVFFCLSFFICLVYKISHAIDTGFIKRFKDIKGSK
ncbi:hypothetical protein ES705_22798 [subsurface metagenome]